MLYGITTDLNLFDLISKHTTAMYFLHVVLLFNHSVGYFISKFYD